MNTYPLSGRIDSSNASSFEEDINRFVNDNKLDELVLDCNDLLYISSAGLRVILHLRKKINNIALINVSPVVYEVLSITGFSEMLVVEKALKEMNIDNGKIIGSGAHGTVYQVAADTIVKVYAENTSIEDIRKEISLARWSFVRGIPTAIPYDVVKVNDKYGAVFELLNAISTADYINESEDNLNDFVLKSYNLMKQIHSIEDKDNELIDMKEKTIKQANGLQDLLDKDRWNKLLRIVNEVNDCNTLLHGDFHLKNILICDKELMLIDMDTLCKGDPIFELATIFNSYYEFPSIDEQAALFLGINKETAFKIYEKTSALFLKDEKRENAETLAKILGCVRILDYIKRHTEKQIQEKVRKACLKDLINFLDEYE